MKKTQTDLVDETSPSAFMDLKGLQYTICFPRSSSWLISGSSRLTPEDWGHGDSAEGVMVTRTRVVYHCRTSGPGPGAII